MAVVTGQRSGQNQLDDLLRRVISREDAGWFYYDTAGGRKTTTDPRGGCASRVSDHVRPRDPGGGAGSTVSPQRMTIDDVFQTVEQSGGGPQLPPPPRGFDGMDRRDYG